MHKIFVCGDILNAVTKDSFFDESIVKKYITQKVLEYKIDIYAKI